MNSIHINIDLVLI